MTGSIYNWSITAASNGTADPDINFAEGQAPSTVNNSARQVMGRLAEYLADQGGALTAGGTANALTVTMNSAFTAYQDGLILSLRIATDNSAAATLNANGLGAKSIRKFVATGETALAGAELQADGIYLFRYSTALNGGAGGWLLLNPTIDTTAFVTLTGVQTLTNKTITGGALNGTLGATTPSTIAGTTGSFSGTLGVTGAVTLSSTLSVAGIISSGNDRALSYQADNRVFANTTAGTMVFRPGGLVVTTGQMTIDTSGNVVSAGSVDATSYTRSGVALPFTKAFESTQQTITSGGTLPVAHGLGVSPKLVSGVLQCVIADNGYNPGEEITIQLGKQDGSPVRGLTVKVDATNLTAYYGTDANVMEIISTGGGNVAAPNARWRLVLRAWA